MNWVSLIAFLVVVFAVATVGAAFTPGEWYEALSKPPWSGSGWGPVGRSYCSDGSYC